MRKLGFAGVVLATCGLVHACGGETTNVGGVSGSGGAAAGTDAGIAAGRSGANSSGGASGSGAGGSGGSQAGCPLDRAAAVGKPCSPEGLVCGDCPECTFCQQLRCVGGAWQQVQVSPEPTCPDAGGDCGGSGSKECPSFMFCNFAGDCGNAGQMDTCTPVPADCDDDCPGVCGCDGKFYCNECYAATVGVDVNAQDTSCFPQGDSCGPAVGSCAEGYFCVFPEPNVCGLAGWQGTCQKKPQNCLPGGPGVCGCDGKFYVNECEANMSGVVVVPNDESCFSNCGGTSGAQCPTGEFCEFQDCGGSFGVCKPKPGSCDTDCPGVCGCDGKFYCNECNANSAGVGIDAGDTSCFPCGFNGGTACDSGLLCCYSCPSGPVTCNTKCHPC